jgi:hypothetical protein
MRLHLGISRIFESGVLRGARRTLHTAHPITSSLSDAAWACLPSLPALRSTEAAFCRFRVCRTCQRACVDVTRLLSIGLSSEFLPNL